MQGKNRVLMTAVILLIAVSQLHAQTPANPTWQRVTLGGGGVCFDIEMADPNGSIHDPVWSACGSNGVYRAEWDDENSVWDAWTEHLTGKYCYGVDVFYNHPVEHVIVATGNYGIFYTYGATGVAPNATWNRPNGDNYPHTDPNDWRSVAIHDVAFWYDPVNGWPTNPEQYLYCILNSTVGDNSPGLYRWQNTTPIGFVRHDGETDPIRYDHFHRDLENPNVLYVTSPDGIYKLSGPYGNPKFEKLPAGTKLQDLPIARPPKDLPPLPVSK